MTQFRGVGPAVDLQTVASVIRTIDEFVASRAPDDELDSSPRESVRAALERGDLRGLRMVLRDSLEMVQGFSSEDQRDLDARLIAQTGRSLFEMGRDTRRQVARVLKRGKIESGDEYRLLTARAEEIHAKRSKKQELDAINGLLREYQGTDDD